MTDPQARRLETMLDNATRKQLAEIPRGLGNGGLAYQTGLAHGLAKALALIAGTTESDECTRSMQRVTGRKPAAVGE